MDLIKATFAQQEMTMSTESKLPQFLRRATFSAALLLLAAPAALADPPSAYSFPDFNQSSQAGTVESTTQTASDAQLAAVDRKAEQALATAREALRKVQQTQTVR
jgi:hypothetical protein